MSYINISDSVAKRIEGLAALLGKNASTYADTVLREHVDRARNSLVTMGATTADCCVRRDVRFAYYGDRVIDTIKLVRSLTGLGLKDAKDIVDDARGAEHCGIIKASLLKDYDNDVARLKNAGCFILD